MSGKRTPVADAPLPSAPTAHSARSPLTGEAWFAISMTAVAIVSFGLMWVGLQPAVLLTVTLVTWFVVAARRIGHVLAAAAVPVGWLTMVFAVMTATPAVSLDPRIATQATLVLATAGSLGVVRRFAPTRPLRPHVPTLLAALSGGALWLVGLAWGALAPRGGGLSWAMYRDSTMDVWELRRVLVYAGIGSGPNVFNWQPLTHAVSASLVSPHATIAASPESALAFLSGHAFHWTALIVLSSFLGGLCVAALGGPGRRGLRTVAVTLVSVLLVMQPVAGVALDLGQINIHLVFVLVMATVLAAVSAPTHAPLAMTVILAAAGLLLATWVPFAIVGAALVPLLWRRLRSHRATRDAKIAWLLPGLVALVWAMWSYGWPILQGAINSETGAGSNGGSLADTTTHNHGELWLSYTNPYSVPLVVALLVAGLVCVGLLRKVAHWRASIGGVAIIALGVGLLPTAAIVRFHFESLNYFPAKHLFLTALCLVPLVVGAALGASARGRGHAVIAGGLIAMVAVVAIASPTRAEIERWIPTPLLIATGGYFGTHADVAGRFIESADSEYLRLPWRLDAAHDGTVGLMMSSVGPDVDEIVLDRTRFVLRTYRNDFAADVACMLAAADTRPLVLTTQDDGLEAELDAACADAGIEVVLAPLSD